MPLDIERWLRDLELERYATAFRDNEIDAATLPCLTDQHLKELGLPLGPRLKLLDAIAKLRGDRVAPVPESPESAPADARPVLGPERRQLTVMFVDLVGSTELSRRLDPEDMSATLRAYQNVVAKTVSRFEGHIAKYMGDGVLVYFGWPVAYEDAVERAVHAALDLTAAVPGLAVAGGPLAARVGIATGPVVVGDLVGSDEARERAVVGESPSLAARLQGLADPGAVVIAEGTRRLLGDLFAYRDLGPASLKGFAEPVTVYQVLGEGAAEDRFAAMHAAGLTPLVGRKHELALLLDHWQRAQEGEGQVVLLSGEAGIGKSRLVRALRERLSGQPHTSLGQFCSPNHINTALYPVIGLLERAAEIRRDEPPERQLEKLEAMLARAVKDGREAAQLLANLLSIPNEGRYPHLELSPQQRKEKTFKALLDQLAGLAMRQPVLTLYEDAHWADPTTLDFLGRVVERVQHLPVLVLITFRPGFVPPWDGYGHVTALSLGRLGRRLGGTMVGRVTGGKALPTEVMEHILARTDGVPLFIEELTKAVLESGLLAEQGDRYTHEGSLPALAIPATLHDSLMARLDRLAPVKTLAQIAACIGREFSYQLLAVVTELRAPDLDRALAELTAAQLVYRRGAPPDVTYSFKHALVQDAAYQSLIKSQRQRLHAKIGTVLEERFPEVAKTQPEALARHYAEGGMTERAIEFLQLAAQQAVARSAMTEAIVQLRQGLAMLDALPDDAARQRRELELQLTLGVPLIASRGMADPEVEQAYTRARQLCIQLGDAPQLFAVLFGLWWFYEVKANLRAARGTANQLLDIAGKEGDPAHLLQAHRTMGHTNLWLGEFVSAHAHFEQAMTLYDPQQHRALAFTSGQEPGVLSRGFAAHVLWYLGFPDRALEMMDAALSLARDVAHPFSLAFALDHSAWLRQYRRETEQTRTLAEADIKFSEEQGFPFFWAHGTILRAWALAHQGQDTEAVAQMRLGLARHEATGALLVRPYWLSLLAWAQSKSGQTEVGLRTLDKALALMKDQRVWGAELHRLKGELTLIRPDDEHARTTPPLLPVVTVAGQPISEAEVCFRQAIDIARQQQARSLELRAAMSLARLWTGEGKSKEARDLLAPVYGWFTEGFDTPDLREARTLLDAVH
jgi:class 3 adenylate cyclase/predicted ATPase